MKHAKLLTVSCGFLSVSVLIGFIVAWWFPRNLEGVDDFRGALGIIGAVLFVLVGLSWAIRGVRGLLIFFSRDEEEKNHFEQRLIRSESKFRGASRGLVITLGLIAIVCFLLVGLFLAQS